MPIKAKPVPKDKVLAFDKQHPARGYIPQGVVPSSPAAADSDDSSSSDDDDDLVAPTQRPTRQPAAVIHRDPEEEFGAYAKRQARQEWLYATGQAGSGAPVPPPKRQAAPQQQQQQAPQPVASVQPKAAVASAAPAAVGMSPITKRYQGVTANAASPSSLAKSAESTGSTPPPESAPVAEPPSAKKTPQQAAKVPTTATAAAAPLPVSEKQKTSVAEPATTTKAVAEAPLRPCDLVTEDEEKANPGRRDFLRLLDLFDEKAAITATPAPSSSTVPSAPPPSQKNAEEGEKKPAVQSVLQNQPSYKGLPLQRIEELEFDRLYNEWLDDTVERPFIAAEAYEKAHSLAVIAESAAQGGFDPSEVHQMYRQRETFIEQQQQEDGKFATCVAALENLVLKPSFVDKVNGILRKFHKQFIASKPLREHGEHSHHDYVAFRVYSDVVQQLVLGELDRAVDDFDADVFIERLFDTPAVTEDDLDHENNAKKGRQEEENGEGGGSQVPALSFHVWEVLLSFLKYESFCDMMDEYIAVNYRVGEGVSRLRSSAARQSHTPSVVTSSSSSSSSAAAGGGSSTTSRSLRELRNVLARPVEEGWKSGTATSTSSTIGSSSKRGGKK